MKRSANSFHLRVYFRKKNVEAAKEVGIVGLHFRSADLLLQDLCLLGLDISADNIA